MSTIPKTQTQRRFMREVWVMLALFGGSLFVMGWLVGGATAAPNPCNRVYEAPPVLGTDYLGRPYYAKPVGLEYVRCLRRQPLRISYAQQGRAVLAS